jgi:MFS family permease
MRWSPGEGVLAQRAFRPLFGARAISAVGDAVAPLALAFAVLDTTGSVSDLGFAFASREVCSVAVLLAAGVWADRVRRERLMICSNLLSAAAQLTTGVLLVSGQIRLWELIALQAVAGASGGAFNPARNALTPQIVPAAQLQPANALLGVTDSASGVIGPVLAAALVTAGSPGIALLTDGVSFLASAALLTMIHTDRPERERSRFVDDLRGGWSEFRSYGWLWKSVALVCVCNMLSGPFFVFGPVISRHDLGGAGAWGAILAASSAGWVVGGLLSVRVRPRRPMLACWVLALLGPCELVALALHPNVEAVAAATLVSGAGLAMGLTYWFTTLQSQVPSESLSRVSSYDDLGSFVFNPIGLALAGPAAAAFGIAHTLLGAAAISLCAVVAALSIPEIRNLRLDSTPVRSAAG